MWPSDGPGRANDRLESDGTLHLAVNPSWGGAGQFGAEAALLDRLSVGRVDASIFEQSQIRRRFWAGIDKRLEQWSGRALTKLKPKQGVRSSPKPLIRVQWASGLRHVLARAPRPKHFILWTSRAWQDRVVEWCLLSALSQSNVDPDWLSIVEPYRADYGTSEGLACYSLDDLKRALPRTAPAGTARIREGASLWAKFTSPAPVAFDAALANGSRLFQGLSEIARRYRAWFPRRQSRQKCLRLSPIDEILLGSFDGSEWRTPMAIFKRKEFHDQVLPVSGDVVCIDRLLQWLDHDSAEPVFELRRVKGPNQIMSMSFRLTPFGRGVLHEGLPSIDAAPPVFIGGCKVYSADAPFVCARERGRPRIVRL